MAEQLNEAVRARDSTETGLKTTEKQFEDIRKQLHYNEINLAIEKPLVTKLREELQKAKEAAQLVKEAAEAEKQAAYTFGVEETQARLTEEFSAVCKDYCDISWGKALDVAGVPADSDLRRSESIYYDLEIRELPSFDSSHPEQAIQISAQLKVDQVPHAPLEVPKDSNQGGGQGKRAEDPKGVNKGQDKKTNPSDPKEKASDTAASQLGQTVDPEISKATVQDRIFQLFLFVVCCFVCFAAFFFKECIIFSLLSMKTFLFCFIHPHNVCYEIHCQSMMVFRHFQLE